MSFLRETLPLSSSLLKGRRNSDNNNINEKSACWLTSMICAYIPLPEPQNFHELGCHTTARIALRKTGKRRRRKRKTEPTNRTRWQGNMWNHQGHTNLTSTSSSGANFWLLSSFFILLEKRVSWSADVPCSHTNTHTHTKPSTNNTIKIVSSRPNLSLSLSLSSLVLSNGESKNYKKTATEKKSTRTLKKPPDIVDVRSL